MLHVINVAICYQFTFTVRGNAFQLIVYLVDIKNSFTHTSTMFHKYTSHQIYIYINCNPKHYTLIFLKIIFLFVWIYFSLLLHIRIISQSFAPHCVIPCVWDIPRRDLQVWFLLLASLRIFNFETFHF